MVLCVVDATVPVASLDDPLLRSQVRTADVVALSKPDLIEPPIEVAADGTIAVPTGPGLGVTIRLDRLERATLRATPDFRLQTSDLR